MQTSEDTLYTKGRVVIWSLFLTQDCSKMDTETLSCEGRHHGLSRKMDVGGRRSTLTDQMAGVS